MWNVHFKAFLYTIVFFLLEKQTFNGLLNVIGVQ